MTSSLTQQNDETVVRRRTNPLPSQLLRALPSICSILGALILWHIAVTWLKTPGYVLPPPADVFGALAEGLTMNPFDRASFWYQLSDTLYATVAGFLIGGAIGIALAAAMAEWKLFERVVLPHMIIIQSIPKIAIAPLFVIWFGYQIESKIAMAATLALFPVLLNSLQGFSTTNPERIEVMQALKASAWQTFWRVKLPSALPLIFAGLSLGIVYSQLGAIVSEFLGGQRGMGVMLMQLESVSDTAGVFAVLIVLAASGYVLMTILRTLHQVVVFWEKPTQSRQI